jgi:RNA polymerase sigma-70 factor (ECF subfamily)
VAVALFCERQTRRWLGPGEDSRDAAQEAAIRAWRMRHQCTTPAEPWGWLARISQREAMRLAARRHEAALPDELAVDATALDSDPLERLAVQAAVAHLAPLDRRLIALRYEHDQTYERIAELMSLPEGTVKVRLHRARHRLRDVLADHRSSR